MANRRNKASCKISNKCNKLILYFHNGILYRIPRSGIYSKLEQKEKEPELPDLLMTQQQRFFNISLNRQVLFYKVRNPDQIVVCSAISAVYLDRLEAILSI